MNPNNCGDPLTVHSNNYWVLCHDVWSPCLSWLWRLQRWERRRWTGRDLSDEYPASEARDLVQWVSFDQQEATEWTSHHSPSERWRSLSASWSGAPADSQRSVWSPLVTCILMRGWSLSFSPSPRCLCRWCRLRWSYCYTCRYEHLDTSRST